MSQIVLCVACGWTGAEPEVTLAREEVCPSCLSDELEYTEPVEPKLAAVELAKAWGCR